MAAGLLERYFNKAFRKKLFLKPLPNGTYEAIDITENEEFLQVDAGAATVLQPSLIIPVSGIKNVAYIAIKEFNKASLLNPFDPNNPGMTEKMLFDIIKQAESHGRNMAEGTDEGDKKQKSRQNVTMICSIAAAIFSLLIYVKVGL